MQTIFGTIYRVSFLKTEQKNSTTEGKKPVAKRKTTDINIDSLKNLECAKIHPALKASFMYCFNKAAVRYRTVIEHLFAKYNLIPAQFGILKFLDVTGPLSQITLGDEMGVDKATMVKLIDGLEKQKYIKRIGDTKDRRIKLIHITPKGFQMLQKGRVAAQAVEDRFLSSLTPQQKTAIVEMMPVLLETSIQMIQDLKK